MEKEKALAQEDEWTMGLGEDMLKAIFPPANALYARLYRPDGHVRVEVFDAYLKMLRACRENIGSGFPLAQPPARPPPSPPPLAVISASFRGMLQQLQAHWRRPKTEAAAPAETAANSGPESQEEPANVTPAGGDEQLTTSENDAPPAQHRPPSLPQEPSDYEE